MSTPDFPYYIHPRNRIHAVLMYLRDGTKHFDELERYTETLQPRMNNLGIQLDRMQGERDLALVEVKELRGELSRAKRRLQSLKERPSRSLVHQVLKSYLANQCMPVIERAARRSQSIGDIKKELDVAWKLVAEVEAFNRASIRYAEGRLLATQRQLTRRKPQKR